MSPSAEIQLVAVVTAVACALPGVFLVLRRVSMLADAISHAILPGIVVAFLATGDLNHPLLLVAAAATGVATVAAIEALRRTGRVREDAAIGLVFPALFALGVVLVARSAGDVHLDVDAVLLGELAFAPFDRFAPGGVDLGPVALWTMGGILLVELALLAAFYKELQASTFDSALAAALGLAPVAVHYGLMSVVSLTAVGAFDAVGSILVVALMVAPPAAAWLLTDRLPRMLALSAGLGAVSALGGYHAARALDTTIAGAMAVSAGLAFALAFAFAPERGLVVLARRRAGQRRTFAATLLAVHLLQHEHSPEADRESRAGHLTEHVGWEPAFARSAVAAAVASGWVMAEGDRLALTDAGRTAARAALVA